MNILLVNYEYPPLGGGAASACRSLGRALHRLGHNPAVLSCAWKDLRGDINEDGFPVRRIESPRSREGQSNLREMWSFMFLAGRHLDGAIRDFHPDHLLAYFTLPCGPLGVKALRRYNIPFTVSLRGGDVPGLVPELSWMHRLLTPYRRSVLKRASHIVANSKGLAELSKTADPFPVEVIPNGVDTNIFNPSPSKETDKKFTFLFTGRFRPQKNLHQLLESFNEVRLRASRPVFLRMVGDGPQRVDLQEKAASLGLTDDHIVFDGWLDRNHLPVVYAEADAFLNPSHYEGMPNTLLEAMASGLPSVVTRVQGQNELIRHEVNGLNFHPANQQELTPLCLRLVEEPDFAHKLGQAARTTVVDNYSWEATAKAYLRLFESS